MPFGGTTADENLKPGSVGVSPASCAIAPGAFGRRVPPASRTRARRDAGAPPEGVPPTLFSQERRVSAQHEVTPVSATKRQYCLLTSPL